MEEHHFSSGSISSCLSRSKNKLLINPMDDDFQIKGSTLTMKNTRDNGKHKISCRISGPLGSTTVSSDLYVVGKFIYLIVVLYWFDYTNLGLRLSSF